MSHMGIWSYMQNENQEFFLGAEARARRILSIVRSRRRPGTLLNIGIGSGYLEALAKQAGWRVVSVDPDPRTCARLAERGIDARVGVVERLPVETQSADVVIATELFEHLTPDSLPEALDEIKRVTSGGGLLIGTVPHRENMASALVVCPHCEKTFHRYGHQQSFTPDSMKAALARRFNVDTCKPVLLPPWNILNWKGKVLAAAQLFLSRLGIHGSSENILFVCSNRT